MYHNPSKIIFNHELIETLPLYLPKKGKVLIVTTPGFTNRGVTAQIKKALSSCQVIVHDQVSPNPDILFLEGTKEALKKYSIEWIVALGGGSVLDTAKVLSLLISSSCSVRLDQLLRSNTEVLWTDNIPIIAVPTTSGTGAEVTPFATVWDSVTKKKFSLSDERLYSNLVLLDPSLSLTLPKQETLYTALDTVSHALESLWNKNKTPISQAYAIEALSLATETLPELINNLSSLSLRRKMQHASLLAGMAISQTQTALAHSISYPLTLHYGVPHGLACSFSLAAIGELIQVNNFSSRKKEIIYDSLALLDKLPLIEHLLRFTTLSKIEEKVPEMITSNRSDNFIFQVNSSIIKRVLSIALRD
ncbi:MAG: iron-containing alcohol dehydrogenase family protein [Candidatus Electrothrix sp. EH2]|nr:iron-containing alcohol dehydrogenase family protein [Candidatus Electrothrix sp. EH2]